jgi:hypothetical protein
VECILRPLATASKSAQTDPRLDHVKSLNDKEKKSLTLKRLYLKGMERHLQDEVTSQKVNTGQKIPLYMVLTKNIHGSPLASKNWANERNNFFQHKTSLGEESYRWFISWRGEMFLFCSTHGRY